MVSKLEGEYEIIHNWRIVKRSSVIALAVLFMSLFVFGVGSTSGCFLSRRAETLSATQQYQQASDAYVSALDSVTLLMETGKITDIKTIDRINTVRKQMNGLLNLMHEKAALNDTVSVQTLVGQAKLLIRELLLLEAKGHETRKPLYLKPSGKKEKRNGRNNDPPNR